MQRSVIGLASALALVGGCSKSTVGSSALTGRVDLSAMGASRAVAVAIDRRGRAQVAPVAADGSFRLDLTARATYHIVLRNVDTRAQVPMVFPRSVTTQTRLRVRGGSSVARALGDVHLMSATASTAGTVDDSAEEEGQSCSGGEEDATKDNDNVDDQSGETGGDTSGGGDTSTTQVAVPSVNPPMEVGDCGGGDGDNVEEQSGDQSGQ